MRTAAGERRRREALTTRADYEHRTLMAPWEASLEVV
jgi:hypothetical protein